MIARLLVMLRRQVRLTRWRRQERRFAQLLVVSGAFDCGCRACLAWRGAFK